MAGPIELVGVQVDIVVRVVDKKGPAAVEASKRGDVIAIMLSGHQWSPAELGFDEWRILRTRVPQSFLEAVLSAVMARKNLRRRDWSIDLDRLPNPEWYRGPRTRPIIDVDADHILRTTYKKILLA